MARQIAQVPITGTLDDITFYMTEESGFLARMKTSLDANRLKNDPRFEGSRRAYTEFGRASAGAGLLRRTMVIAGKELSDTRIVSRLTARLVSVTGTDTSNLKGERLLDNADLSGLVGFEWNKKQAWGGVCRFEPVCRIDAGSGMMEVAIPKLSKSSFTAPLGATHYELIMEGGGVCFGDDKTEGVAEHVTGGTGWKRLNTASPAQVLDGKVAVAEGRRLMVGVGVRFGEDVNGEVRALNRIGVAFFIGAVV